MVLVDVGNDGGHFINSVAEERLATHHLRHAQWRIHVEATKVIVNGQELQWRKRKEIGTLQIEFKEGETVVCERECVSVCMHVGVRLLVHIQETANVETSEREMKIEEDCSQVLAL